MLKKSDSSNPSLLRRLLRNRSGTAGLILVTLYLIIGVLGAVGVTPYPSLEQHARDRLKPPSVQYALGTDLFGRDVASRLMEGAANSLRVALLSVAISASFGTLVGTTAGYVGGRFDNIMMRVMDVFFALPALLMALVIVSILGPGINTTVLAIAIVYTPIFARVARGPVLSVKEMEFVLASRCLGTSDARIIARHILPNTLAPLIVQVSLALSWSLLTEAGLSFLGLGTQPPTPSWGVMLSESRGIAEMAPWLMLFPAVAIVLGVLSFNLLGDGLRDVLDPRLRGQKG
ncbi:Glutathione transport system permease protein GsiD [Anaerolineae bacterium]|nr:Glutathione transport system permease protein GsiD [Anaerolineae bacterium]